MKRKSVKATTRVLIALLAAMTLAACATTTDEQPPTTTDSAVDDSEFKQGQIEEPPPEPTTRPEVDLGTVYFDFDRSDIRPDARPILRANAENLRGTGIKVIIEGHCDERGSEEYNQALGERRASTVKRYLENLGVSRSQMQTVSYGETRPAVLGGSEAAWKYNRRAAFTLVE